MTALTNTRGFFGQMADLIAADHWQFKLAAKRARVYRQTLQELSALSNRELDDIGVAPGDIHRIATEAARSVRA